ncbi:MAG: PrsW family intramembrane metalloprotease [Candidatus Nealsonbacteria bacterium]
MNIIYPILIFFGLAPSIIWLLFFLKKDNLPESKRMILKIFFFGMLATVPTALLELGFFETVGELNLPPLLFIILYAFLGIGFMEEILKYFVVKKMVLRHHEFDEPVDAMLYMIIAALGFAALENLLILLPMSANFQFFEAALVSIFRFVGATFLHALCSGLLGYYIALSFFQTKNKTKLIIKGILWATLLHGLYDLSIMKADGGFKFILPVIILMGLIIFVTMGFQKVKKLKSICKL